MSERELVHQSERCKTKDRSLAARLQSAASTQFAGLRAAGRVCTNTSGDAGMKKASTRLLEQETQTPSPAPDLIPAESSLRTYIGIGTANGGTSERRTRSATGVYSTGKARTERVRRKLQRPAAG